MRVKIHTRSEIEEKMGKAMQRGRGGEKENEGFREAWGWMMAGEAVGRGERERERDRIGAKSMSLSHLFGEETVQEWAIG